LERKFGVHICGEGGEFESLVLDCPFFVKRLEIVESESISSGNDVFYLKPTKFRVVDKTIEKDGEFHNINSENQDWASFVPKIPVLSETFQGIYDNLEAFAKDKNSELSSSSESVLVFGSSPLKTVKKMGNKLFVSNITSSKHSLKEQVQDVFLQLTEILGSYDINFSHIQHSTLLLSSMSDFQEINSYYVQYFTNPLPPSRVCIETKLPSASFLQLSVVVLINSIRKTGVHIQGRSYWAPANIGPYSQTIMDENLTASISGQIPLIPATMELSTNDDLYDIVLSLQHFNNVKDIIGAVNQLSTVAFIKSIGFVKNLVKVWEEYTELDLEGSNPLKSLIIVQITEMPKGANVEWGGLSYKQVTSLYDDDSDEETPTEDLSLQFKELSIKSNEQEQVQNLSLTKEEFSGLKLRSDYHYTIYTRPESIPSHDPLYSIDYIPVSRVWNYKGELKDFGVVVRI
jgi:diphthine-ammonia ligase